MRPDDGRINLYPIAVIGILAIVAVASISPVVRLNSTPPPDFLGVAASARGADRSEAAAYWATAVQVIQWKYRRTDPLPEEAPADFYPGDAAHANTPQEQAARVAYWAKLRQEWRRAENWHRSLDINFSWIVDNAQSLSHGLHDFFVDHT